MPAIDREEVFEVTIPAETPEAAPVVFPTHFNPGTVVEVEVVIPAGAAGLAGVRVVTNRAQIWPRTRGAWFIGDNEAVKREVYNWPNSGRLELEGYNTGKFAHSFQVRYGVVENAIPAPAPGAVTSTPVEVAPSGEVVTQEAPPPPPPPPPAEGSGETEPPPAGEPPAKPEEGGSGEPAPTPEAPAPEPEGAAPPPPPEEAQAPTPAPPEAPGVEPPTPEGVEPGTPAAVAATPTPSGPAGVEAKRKKKGLPTEKQIQEYRKAHHGQLGTVKQVEAWLAARSKHKGAARKGAPVKGKKSSVTRRAPAAHVSATHPARRVAAAHASVARSAPHRATAPTRRAPAARAAHAPAPRHAPPPPPPPPRRAPPPPPPRRKRR